MGVLAAAEGYRNQLKQLALDIRRLETKLTDMRMQRMRVQKQLDALGTPPLPGLDKDEKCAISKHELDNVGNKFLPPACGVCRPGRRPLLAMD